MDAINNPNYFEGYGEASAAEALDVVKALQAQEGVTDIALLQGAGALQPQSLETQLALLTFQEKHIKFFKDIGIQKAYSTLEEYSIQDGYGHEGGFVSQLENPDEADPEFQRKFAVVKYIRTLWRTADVLQYTRTITSAEMKNVQAAMLRAMRIAERELFFGDTDVVPTGWDGLKKTIIGNGSAAHVIDLRGASLSETIMKQAAELISSNYGVPSKLYCSNSVKTGIDSLLFDAGAQRYDQLAVSGTGLVGLGHSVNEMRTGFGNFTIEPDIFINPESQIVPTIKDTANPGQFVEGATGAKAPATPTFTHSAQTGVSGSLWATSGSGGAIAGAYNYRVVAVNAYGKSIAAAAQSETVVAGGSITLAITQGAGTYAATGYEIYRETYPGSGKYRFLKAIKKTGSPMNFVDKNDDLAGTSQAFLVDNTTVGEERTMALAQLAPMHRVTYAKIAPYVWGTVNFYAVPKWYAPLRYVLFKNIGIGKEIRNPLIDL